MKIPYVDLKKQYRSEKKNILKIIDRTLLSGNWVGGKEVESFEKKISEICNTKYCVSTKNSTLAQTNTTIRVLVG